MTSPSRLTVVVPVYNGERYLQACLESVADAVLGVEPTRRVELEVIVCDNHSTDTTSTIAQAIDFHCAARFVRPDQHEENRTRNWRAGLDAASGTWMMMLHADDLLARTGLSSLLKAIDRPEARGASLIVGRHRTFDDMSDPSRLRPWWPLPSVVDGRRLAQEVLPYHCPFVPFILMRRDMYEEVGGLDETWELVQDWELWMRLSGRGDVLCLPQEVGWWRVHDSSPRYKRMNAREHVQLAEAVERSVGPLGPGALAEAREVALARASVHLRSAGAAPSDEAWLEGLSLPAPETAAIGLHRMHRRIAARQALLRARGLPRWAYGRSGVKRAA